ncbi:MAG: alpha-amylase/4-alpha-glucanotransferase domain-containing protein [Polyangia bacterium]
MSLRLLFAIHNHQPEGNFGDVMQSAYDTCYVRIIDALYAHPRMKVSLHHTGPLLEWIELNRPDYFARLRVLVGRGQVELLGGGFYEPMLSILPERDAIGQIVMMADYLERHFGKRPDGMWLAERVWEPGLVRPIVEAGMRFTLVDDSHFRAAGLGGTLRGYHVTEKSGQPLAVFPIDRRLRESIPFWEPHRAREVLAEFDREASGAVTYGDDGEKFGLWPGTFDWVWNKGWLDGFFRMIEGSSNVESSHFADELERTPPQGRVYLPTASYEEMGEWSLPASAQSEYLALRHRLGERGELERARPFVRGGIWQGFLTKYEEANQMHKRMIGVSDRLELATRGGSTPDLDVARNALYRAQCNCAYWHGLFGGIYLNYLRDAVYRQLLIAEAFTDAALGGPAPSWAHPSAAAPALVEDTRDHDADLRDEVALRSAQLAIMVRPHDGGALEQLACRDKTFLLTNVLARRNEGYHDKVRAQQAGGHDGARAKEAGLERLLAYDARPRHCFVDRFLFGDDPLEAYATNRHRERGDFVGAVYARTTAPLGIIALARDGHVDGRPVRLEKRYTLSGSQLSVRYTLTLGDGEPLDVVFAPELALTLLDGRSPERVFAIPGRTLSAEEQLLASTGLFANVTELELVNRANGFQLSILPSWPVDVWRFPLETVSSSEGGFERTYQGSVVVPRYTVRLNAGQPLELSLELTAKDL